ncbi:MAG TPA: spore coat protein [Paenibacillaceae bacterium]
MSIQTHGGLEGMEVRVNRGGPESVTGTLVASLNDVLVLKLPNGTVVYFNLEHVKSVTPLVNQNRTRAGAVHALFPPWLTFRGVLESFGHRFVQINQGGPEKVEGILAGVTGNAVTLVSGKEVIRIAIHHIRSVNLLTAQRKNGTSGR